MTTLTEPSTRLAEITERAANATPGPWHWRGNTDMHNIYLGNNKDVVLSLVAVERTRDDREISNLVSYWVDTDECPSDEELVKEYALDPDDDDYETRLDAARATAMRERAVEEWLTDDQYGNPPTDLRLAVKDPSDTWALSALENHVVYEVAPSATSRTDPSVYRADFNKTRSPDAEFIAHARADIDYLLAELAKRDATIAALQTPRDRRARPGVIPH